MLEIVGTVLSAILSGGATGLLGVLIQRWFDMRNRAQDLELVKLNHAQALAMADKEWAGKQALGQLDLAGREVEARALVEQAQAQADGQVQAASYAHDGAKFLTSAALRSRSRVVLWSMALVDAARGLVRPVLTGYLVWVSHSMYRDLQAMLERYGQQLPATTVRELLLQVIGTLLYLATVAVVWWFGTRPPAQPRR